MGMNTLDGGDRPGLGGDWSDWELSLQPDFQDPLADPDTPAPATYGRGVGGLVLSELRPGQGPSQLSLGPGIAGITMRAIDFERPK